MADLNLSCPRKNSGIITSTLAWSGSVPHNMSPWSLQNGRPEALIYNDRISPDHCCVCIVWLRDEHGTTMIVEGLRSRSRCSHDEAFSFSFLRRGSTVYNYHTCTVSSGDDHHTTMTFSSCRFDGLDGWYLEVFFVRSGSCRCYVWIVWYRDEHHTNGDRHDGSHPRVLSVTLPVIIAWLQNKSQCWSLLYLFCMVLWWTPYHHDLWGTRSPKRLVAMSIVVIGLCGLVIHIHSRDTWWTLTPEVAVVMMAVVLCFLCSFTGRRPACAKYALCGPVTWTCERFSKTDGGWNGGISPGVFSVTVQVSVLYVIFFLERRCEEVPVMNIDIFALYGLVMNLTPPWSLRDGLQKLCLTWFFSSVLDGHCYICFAWCLDEDTTMIVVDRTLDAPSSWRKPSDFFTAYVSLCGFLMNTSHCDVSRTLVSIPPRSARYPLTNDNWHGGSHLRVSSVTEPVIVFVLRTAIFALCVHVMNTIPSTSLRRALVQASSLTLWDFLFARRVQWLSSFRLRCLVPWWTSFPPGYGEDCLHKG